MVLQSLSHSILKISGKIPLRVILVVPFVLQIFTAVGLVGYLSFKNGQKAVEDLAGQLQEEISDRIEQKLANYFTIPSLINQITARAIRSNLLRLDNQASLEHYFWNQVQVFDTVSYIYFGNEQGGLASAGRLDDGSLIIEATDNFVAGDYKIYSTNHQGQRLELISVQDHHDTRVRPWYKNAVQAGQPIWGEIYAYAAYPTLGIPFVEPFYDQTGKVQGVLSVDLNISHVSEFLRHLEIGRSGETFIMERSGLLVASSTAKTPFKKTDKEIRRLRARESNEPLIRSTAHYLIDYFGNLNQISHSQQLDFRLEGRRHFVQVHPFQDEFGLDWLIVVVVPEADFMEQIYANTRTTLLLCIAALLVATSAGLLTSRWIAQPIMQLKAAATALSEENFDQTVNLDRSDEVGVLAKAFNRMALQLQESFVALEHKNTELQHLDQLKDEFLANTSHELRTPLNGIIGIAESLIDGAAGQLPTKAQENLAMIASSGRRLSNLVNDILDFSKLKHHNLELQIKPVGLRAIVDVVLNTSQPLISKKPLQLINSVPPDFPLVHADENRLQQIFYNLIGNAIKFTEQGTIEVSAQVKNRDSLSMNIDNTPAESQQATIIVADTGIGIPENKLEKIFESFEQADGSTSRKYGGTGLGLAVTKKLVELQGGTIRVTSTVGVGSQFRFSLPLSTQPRQDVSPASQSPVLVQYPLIDEDEDEDDLTPLETQVCSLESFKILVVDDEPINLKVLENQLSLANYSLMYATNGLESLEIIESGFKPDLILLDVMMPRMTGYEVCQRLRVNFLASELPIVMLTAKNRPTDLVEGFMSGANDYLIKPFSKSELLARIKTHIRLTQINKAYGRFVPHDFLRFLGHESIVDVQLGDHIQKEMTIMFSDIRSFTSLSEALSPQENFNFINDYLSRVSPVIRENRGFIDKYIGDAVMALFPESADDAVRGAIAMQHQVTRYNEYRQQQGDVPIAIGIGLHTGSLMLGTIGERERMESTVIADAVNLASRLEGLTKVYGANILVSGQTLFKLEDFQNYNYRFLERVTVEGRKLAVAVFEVFDGDSPNSQRLKRQTKTLFEQGVLLFYQQRFAEAKRIFQEIVTINPQDKAAVFYLNKSLPGFLTKI
jgi:two-component system sensor histidine kinase ChiS